MTIDVALGMCAGMVTRLVRITHISDRRTPGEKPK